MGRGKGIISFRLLAAAFLCTGGAAFSFPEPLSPFTTTVFTADGRIPEFINYQGDSQQYFITDPLLAGPPAAPNFGAIRAGATVTPGVFVLRDNSPIPGTVTAAGPTGFKDLPGALGDQFVPTGFNIGRVFASYHPKAYGGANGGAYFLAFDISAPGDLDQLSGTRPVAFDVDGNGSRLTATELNAAALGISEAPLNADKINREGYSLRINTDGMGASEITITIGEQVEFLPAGAVPIDPGGKPQMINGFEVRRYVLIRDTTGKLVGTPQQLALLFLDSNDDGVVDYRDFGVDEDVELVIRNVGLLPRNSQPACATFTFIADSFDDQALGGGGEEAVTLVATFPVPDIEVTKEARCVGEPDEAFRSEVHVTPGSEVEYRVAIQNWGNVPLDVTLDDVLGCQSPATAGVVPGSCVIVGNLPAGVPADFCSRLESAFAMPGGFPLAVGRLEAGSACAVGSGETLTFTFRSLIGPPGANAAFCDQDVDCTNRISVSGTAPTVKLILPPDPSTGVSGNDEEEDCATAACCTGIPGCIPGDGIGDVQDEITATVSDVAGVVDTDRELLAGGDDNVVSIEIECRGINLVKDVRQLPSGSFVTELTRLDLPAAPVGIEFRYTVSNMGEVPVQVTVVDNTLCDDLAAVLAAHPGGLTLANCPICSSPPSGQVAGVAPVGGPAFVATCQVNFTSEAALRAFMTADDSRTACRALTGQGSADPFCHRNCATARAVSGTVAGVCSNPGEITDDSFATVCHEFCDLSVTKTAQCVDCASRNPIGSAATLLQTTRGSCTDFIVSIQNTNPTTSICGLRITDTLSGSPNVVFDGNVRIAKGQQSCTVPGGFNVTGTPFDLNLPAACGGALAPGETLTLRFTASVPANANPAISPRNVVNVEGAAFCGGGVPSFTCMGNADSTLDILNPQLACQNKTWEIQSDTDADCNPDGEFDFGADLGTAVFPVVLRARIKATNTGDAPLSVTATDTVLQNCVNTVAGVDFAQGMPCELGVKKMIAPAAMEEWVCSIRIQSVAAFDALDACDGSFDGRYLNSASVSGTVSAAGVCIGSGATAACPGGLDTPIGGPRDCDILVDKSVKCAGQPDSAYAAGIDVAPGSTQRFRIRVTNGPEGAILPQICITDSLSCGTLFVPNSVAADLAGTNVTSCLMPMFAAGLTGGTRQCYTFGACRPAAPWIAPGETLTIVFDVFVPDAFNTLGQDPDCRNNVTVDVYQDACQVSPLPADRCATGTGQAQFDVRVPRATCLKEVCVDTDGIGGCDAPYSGSVSLGPETTYPINVNYRFTVTNTGETSLANVQFCDAEILGDLAAAGINTASCQLSAPSGCTSPTILAPGSNVMRTCQFTVPHRGAWETFAGSDTDRDPDCYANSGRGMGNVDTSGLCSSAEIPAVLTTPCNAVLCIEPPAEGACCRLDGRCDIATEFECEQAAGLYNGDNTQCLGDQNRNGIDDACEERIPTVSSWGLLVLALLLLIGSKLRFHRPAVETVG